MEQELKYLSYGTYEYEIKSMKAKGFYIKEITSGSDHNVWVLFEKNNISSNSL